MERYARASQRKMITTVIPLGKKHVFQVISRMDTPKYGETLRVT